MKKRWIFLLIGILLILQVIIIIFVFNKEEKSSIPNNYIAVFKGESAEEIHTTYLYQKKKNKKYTYNYINTITTTNSYDDTILQEKIVKKGKLKKKTDIFKIAEKNNADTYVKYQKDEEIYSMVEFKKIWK